MKRLVDLIWPWPITSTVHEVEEQKLAARVLNDKIRGMQGLTTATPELFLDAARRIADEEEKRKSGAEARATTFIAAVAALIPLMTWSIGNTMPKCDAVWGWCAGWTAVFVAAVVYFVTAAAWALRSLAVANYIVIGVEDLVQVRTDGKDLQRELIRKTLLQAHGNRNTINQKVGQIRIAQQCFFNGLVLLAVLLVLDPIAKLRPALTAQATISAPTSQPASASPAQPAQRGGAVVAPASAPKAR